MSKKEEKIAFDLDDAIEKYECSNMLKKGITAYFHDNKIIIKNDKEFEKAVQEYLKLKIGE